MTYGSEIVIRKARAADLEQVKQLVDGHRHELGFVRRPALERNISTGQMFVADQNHTPVGFVDYHHRIDKQTTLYHLAVLPSFRQLGIGRLLFDALVEEASMLGQKMLQLKCPVDLVEANLFYERVGCRLLGAQSGKTRKLNNWEKAIDT